MSNDGRQPPSGPSPSLHVLTPRHTPLFPQVRRDHPRPAASRVALAAPARCGSGHSSGSGGEGHAPDAHGLRREYARFLPAGVLAEGDGSELRASRSCSSRWRRIGRISRSSPGSITDTRAATSRSTPTSAACARWMRKGMPEGNITIDQRAAEIDRRRDAVPVAHDRI